VRAFWGIVTLAITAGLVYVSVGVIDLMNLCYSYKGFKFQGLLDGSGKPTINPFNFKYAKIDIYVSIYNPSYLSVTISSYNLGLLINGVPAAILPPPKSPIVLQSKVKQTLTLSATIDMDALRKKLGSDEILNDFIGKKLDKIIITTQGNVTAYKLNKTITMSMSLQDVQNIMNSPSDGTEKPC
jgi:hypothetical protein